MGRNLKEAIQHRRSYYSISSDSRLTDEQIQELVEFAALHVPSPFNSQLDRFVLLFGKQHQRLWDIVKECLRKIVPADKFGPTDKKIDAFAAGHGTVLFFTDQSVTENLQKQFPLYQEKFPVWAQHSIAMHQFAVWTLLEDAGFGASLQHYNPVIDEMVHKEWNLDAKWELTAQMPFGIPTAEPGEKQFSPLADRVKVFK